MGETLLTYEGVSVGREGHTWNQVAALQHGAAPLCESCTEQVVVFLPSQQQHLQGGLPVLWTITDKILNDSVHKAALPRGKRSGERRTWGVHSW